MIELNLEIKSKEEEMIKKFLEENVSEVLASKINNGVSVKKDGQTVINKKTLHPALYQVRPLRGCVSHGAEAPVLLPVRQGRELGRLQGPECYGLHGMQML